MNVRDWCSTWRSLDPSYPSNVAVVLGAGLAWLAWGGTAGLAVFFAWALARELDPDHPGSALLAGMLAALWGGYSSGLFPLLLGMRVVNRTTGLPARVLDSTLLLGLAWARPASAWIVAAAFLLDAILENGLRRHFVFGAMALVSMAGCDNLSGSGVSPELSWGLLLCLSFLSLCFKIEPLHSRGDAGGGRLDPGRVLAAQCLGVLCALLSVWCWQALGVYAWWSLWSGLFAVVFWRAGSRVWRPAAPPAGGAAGLIDPAGSDSEPACKPE